MPITLSRILVPAFVWVCAQWAWAQSVDVMSANVTEGAFQWVNHASAGTGTFSAAWTVPTAGQGDYITLEGNTSPLTGLSLSSMAATLDQGMSGPGFNVYDLSPIGEASTSTMTLVGASSPVTITLSGAWLQTDAGSGHVQLFLKLDTDPQFQVGGLSNSYTNFDLQMALSAINVDQVGSGTYSGALTLTGQAVPEPSSILIVSGLAAMLARRRPLRETGNEDGNE